MKWRRVGGRRSKTRRMKRAEIVRLRNFPSFIIATRNNDLVHPPREILLDFELEEREMEIDRYIDR